LGGPWLAPPKFFVPHPVFNTWGMQNSKKEKIKESVFLITLFSGKKKKKFRFFILGSTRSPRILYRMLLIFHFQISFKAKFG
jgi:hypothetical protein